MIEIGSKVDGRYRIMGRIAHGGMADIYEAYDVVLRLPVALKLMRSGNASPRQASTTPTS